MRRAASASASRSESSTARGALVARAESKDARRRCASTLAALRMESARASNCERSCVIRRSLSETRHCVTPSRIAAISTVVPTLAQTTTRTRLALFLDMSSNTSLKNAVRPAPAKLRRASCVAGPIALATIPLPDEGGFPSRPAARRSPTPRGTRRI